ncbi:MAG: hypothetical protein ACLP7P_08505 [Rhodomicrobium sp.]
MARKTAVELSEGPNRFRGRHSEFTRDVLTPPGAPAMARYRVRSILTPIEVRRAIVADIATKAETVRVRSLARRLTRLDRALSEAEAAALYRIVNAINDACNIGCIDYGGSNVRSSPYGRLPFSERRQIEMRAKSELVTKRLGAAYERYVLYMLARWLNPGSEVRVPRISDGLLTTIKIIAQAALVFYQEFDARKKH